MRYRSFLTLYALVVFCTLCVSTESAWNGHTTPGSKTLAPFTPYYVPPGARGYDSESPFLHYSGSWKEVFSSRYTHKSMRSTHAAKASMTFRFTGTGVEWFGNMNNRHGISEVYLDGRLIQRVDAYSATANPQQRLFWVYDLPHGRHKLKIINTGQKNKRSRGTYMDIDALVVTGTPKAADPPADNNHAAVNYLRSDLETSFASISSQWSLTQKGSTGVHAMQLAVISNTHAIIVDKVEHNPLTISGHPAWGVLYNLETHAVKPLSMQSNSFCAGGTFLSNGTLINVGGNPVVEDRTAAADFGDVDGLQGVRIFEPCDSENVDGCDIYEAPSRIRLASPRWYNTVLRISDGSAMIIGGSTRGGWMNNETTNNPSLEYFPPKDIHGSNGLPIHLPFLIDTLNSNLFPIAFSLPEGGVFVAANQDAMIYNWQANTERRLPRIPNGVRVTYPMAGTGLLLPLSPDNGYVPEILLCGGSTIDDKKPSYEISSQDPASAQCSRIVLTEDGISAGWQVEQMPEARTMADAVLLPTGQVLIVNGAGTGISGYGNVLNQVGQSNADHPTLQAVIYDPSAPAGQRFSSAGLPQSDIPRLYHSVATLTPSGAVMIAGSNPNLDRSETQYGTEYRVEWLYPPYMSVERPTITDVPQAIDFGQNVEFTINLPSSLGSSDIKVVLMDYGYVTHAVHANSRLVYLEFTVADDKGSVSVTGPPNGFIYPPGPGWLLAVAGGVPSVAQKVMIGAGVGPEVNDGAIANLLASSQSI